MADRLDWLFRQLVTEGEFDLNSDKLELADQRLMSDQGLVGIFSGAVVTEKAGTPDLSVDIGGPAVVYDQQGQRVSFSPTQNLDVSLDENAVSTAVAGGGNEKTLSVFIEFDRLLSDPRLDGNAVTVFFKRDESFKLNVVQSAEAALGTSVPPPLRADQILLADILLINAQTQVLNADINPFATNRREDAFVITGFSTDIREGTVNDVLQSFVAQINGDFVKNTGDETQSGSLLINPAADRSEQILEVSPTIEQSRGLIGVSPVVGHGWALEQHGFPAGPIVEYQESWANFDEAVHTAPWRVVESLGGLITKQNPAGVGFNTAAIGFSTQANSEEAAVISDSPVAMLKTEADSVLMVEFALLIDNVGDAENQFSYWGFADNETTVRADGAASGAWFKYTLSSDTMEAQSADGAVIQTSALSAPSAGAPEMWRIYSQGSGVTGGAVVRFYRNNVLVATHTTRVPAPPHDSEVFVSSKATGVITHVGSQLRCGALRWVTPAFANSMILP